MILALETSCDDTCAAVVTHAGEIRSNVVSSQAVHARFGGVVPEWASRHHLEQVNAIVDAALEGTSLDDDRAGRGHPGAGPGRRAADRRRDREGARGLAPAAAGGGQPPAGARRGELPRRAFEPPFLCLVASRRAHVPGAGERARRLRDARADARRRRRRGVRQGRAAARPRLSRAGRRCRSWRWRATRSAFKFPIAARRWRGLDFSFAGLKTALLYKVRDLGPDAEAQRADLAASYEHAIVEALMLRVRARAGRRARAARWRSAAASPRTACCASARAGSASPSTCPPRSSAPTTPR